jgi:iron complex transport system permease protein
VFAVADTSLQGGVGNAGGRASTSGLALVWGASAVVLMACLLAAFRLGLAADLAGLLALNGPRVLFGAAAGAAFAGAGALRQRTSREPALRELSLLAVSTGAAAGGFALANALPSLPAPLAFVAGAALGAGLLLAGVRLADRPHRAANLAVAGLLVVMIGAAALGGTYARARRDFVAPLATWLLGDLGGARFASGATLAVLAALVLGLGAAALARGDAARARAASWLAFGLGVGAAGPLAFVGMVPRAVRALAPGAAPRAGVAASAVAGAATVAAVDAVPRWLVGGYDFPWNVPAALLAIPIFLGWNRARLRREVGRAHPLYEGLELAVIVALTIGGTALAVVLTRVVRAAT